MCGFCDVLVCVCVGFVMCECLCVCVGVWVLQCVSVCMCVVCNVWVFWYYVWAL